MPTRSNDQGPKKPIVPSTPAGWNNLLAAAIKRAEATNDNRLAGLKRAMMESTAEKTLRKFGILSDVDLQREFPE